MAHSGDDTIISMHAGRHAASAPILSQIEAYWTALRNENNIPLRSQVSPRGIKSALRYSFILERIAPGHARFRLAGLHLNELMGMEIRGMPFSAIFTTDARNLLSETLEQVFEGPAVLKMRLASNSGIAKPALAANLLLLPLKSDFGDITRALGCLVAEGQTGRAPRRFHIKSHVASSLNCQQPVSPQQKQDTLPRQTAAGFGDPATPFAAKPYLRLVHSAD